MVDDQHFDRRPLGLEFQSRHLLYNVLEDFIGTPLQEESYANEQVEHTIESER